MRDKTKLTIGTTIWWLLAVPSAGMAMMAPMMFDAPGSLESPLTVAAALWVVSCPLTAILCPVLAWIAFALSWRNVAFALIVVPIVPILGVVLVFTIISVGCSGLFSCHG